MFAFLINAFKIIFLLGFLILIHEGGHFLFAQLFKVKVKEFSIGFGPKVWDKQGKETKYTIRLIPLGGYVNMLGEEERSEEEGSFNKASIPKRMIILVAGGLVNIIFGLLLYFCLVAGITSNIGIAFEATKDSRWSRPTYGASGNFYDCSCNYWICRFCVYACFNISISWYNKSFTFSTIRWRKSSTINNRSYKKETTKGKYRNRFTNGRIFPINRIINICSI